jgi:hypothetical protein
MADQALVTVGTFDAHVTWLAYPPSSLPLSGEC